MKIQAQQKSPRPRLTAKLGASRQVAIPKQLHDKLGLAPGDRIEFERRGNKLILTPQALVEKHLAEGLDDLRKGRVSPAFRNVEEFKRYLKNR